MVQNWFQKLFSGLPRNDTFYTQSPIYETLLIFNAIVTVKPSWDTDFLTRFSITIDLEVQIVLDLLKHPSLNRY